MAATIESLRHLLSSLPTDANERRQLHNLAHTLTLALETPQDAMHRIFWSAAQLPMTQVGVDLGLFRTLSSDPERIFTVEELSQAFQSTIQSETATAEPAKPEPTLVHRVARYLASFALIDEISTSTSTATPSTPQPGYRANRTTLWLSSPGAEGGVTHFLRTITPVFQALPSTLRETNYTNPNNPLNTAFQRAHNTTSHGYSWIPSDPSLLSAFFTFLQSQQQRPDATQTQWPSVLDPALLTLSATDLAANRILMVDVGGGTGPQSLLLRSSFPEASGRIIIQDQSAVLSRADTSILAASGIETMIHDFFTPQPVLGAKVYFLKNIIHDWPDEQCRLILRQISKVLRADSVVVLVDCVLPDVKPSWKMVQMDVQMMAALAAVERTEGQWRGLLEGVGLVVRDFLMLDRETGRCVVVAGLAG